MAKGRVIKKFSGKHDVEVRAGTGKLSGRSCVVQTDATPSAKMVRRMGEAASTLRFYGCYGEQSAAMEKAQALANARVGRNVGRGVAGLGGAKRGKKSTRDVATVQTKGAQHRGVVKRGGRIVGVSRWYDRSEGFTRNDLIELARDDALDKGNGLHDVASRRKSRRRGRGMLGGGGGTFGF